MGEQPEVSIHPFTRITLRRRGDPRKPAEGFAQVMRTETERPADARSCAILTKLQEFDRNVR